MVIYQNFIGIDIGKFNFVVAVHGDKKTHEYAYDASSITKFLKDLKDILPQSLVILETTGGYEMELLLTLCDKDYQVHRANTRKVKSFILSFGQSAKTDSLDAKALAYYGFERHQCLDCFTPASKHMSDLYSLIQRRKDLKQMLVAEKNRLQSPKASLINNSCQAMIAAIAEQIKNISQQIEELISSEQTLLVRQELLKTIPGIGDIIAQELLVMMPELGTMNRRQAASLAGVAPKAHESGKLKRYRRCQHGRDIIKPMLFLAAMAARRSNSQLKVFYENLIARGKKKMVALTALMRKIIVIANARLAQWQKEQMVENTQMPS